MDQPTYTPVQKILEARGTLYFSFQDLDQTKPAGSVRIRTETISYYLHRSGPIIMANKIAHLNEGCVSEKVPTRGGLSATAHYADT